MQSVNDIGKGNDGMAVGAVVGIHERANWQPHWTIEKYDANGKLVGKTVAERALQVGIKKVVFDRGGYVYTGRVAEVAAGAREAGLDF